MCPGRRMAEFEILVMLATLLRRFPAFHLIQDPADVKAIDAISIFPRPLGFRFEKPTKAALASNACA